jgi:hypothetical protein
MNRRALRAASGRVEGMRLIRFPALTCWAKYMASLKGLSRWCSRKFRRSGARPPVKSTQVGTRHPADLFAARTEGYPAFRSASKMSR